MPFNALDLVLVGLVVGAGVGGWRLGFVARAASWGGMAVGLLLAARALPAVVTAAERSAGRAQLVLVAVVLLVGGAFAGQAIGLLLGTRLHLGIHSTEGRTVDAIGGAVAGVLGVLVAVWILVPAIADVPGWEARQVRTSRVTRAVDLLFPAPPDATRTLRQLLGEQYPRVFDALRPSPEVGPPPAASGLSRETSDQVVRSTVKVTGEACGRIQEGSGFVVGPDLVVTNAHVVAGERTSLLERSDGSRVPARVVAFDPRRDVAVLSAPGMDRPALVLADIGVAGRGAVFGHPGGGALRIAPFSVGQRITALGRDIYGEERTSRDVLVLASALAPGDSGGALVDPTGRVVGVAFAIAPDEPGVAYALTTAELRPVLAAAGRGDADTGACVA